MLKLNRIVFLLYVVLEGEIKLIFTVGILVCALTVSIPKDEKLSKTTNNTAKLL